VLPPAPRLLTFDLFGTVVDWRSGLRLACAAHGFPLDDPAFERIIDAQAEDEQGVFRPYVEIVQRSLVRGLGMPPAEARAIGEAAGEWPVFGDAPSAFRGLLETAPCAATTNSDLRHRAPIEDQLGVRLEPWICAEEVGAYKPDERIWTAAAARAGIAPGRDWWHVSAYADYDLATARRLGLTCVLVRRPHHRPGTSDLVDLDVADLDELRAMLARTH
jgi:2-haloalkanoic acid dehalogenase type II